MQMQSGNCSYSTVELPQSPSWLCTTCCGIFCSFSFSLKYQLENLPVYIVAWCTYTHTGVCPQRGLLNGGLAFWHCDTQLLKSRTRYCERETPFRGSLPSSNSTNTTNVSRHTCRRRRHIVDCPVQQFNRDIASQSTPVQGRLRDPVDYVATTNNGYAMLMMMCPNCRHRFPVPGCCNLGPQADSGNLIPQGFDNSNGCFINAPTIFNGPTIIQTNGQNGFNRIHAWKEEEDNVIRLSSYRSSPDYQMNTTCDLTGGTVTITTPRIQSGGCLIQSTDSSIFTQSPRIEIRPKLSGGGCLVQKQLTSEDSTSSESIFFDSYSEDFTDVRYFEESLLNDEETEEMRLIPPPPPSGCQELPGIRRNSTVKTPKDQSSCGHHQVPPRVFNNVQPSCDFSTRFNDNQQRQSGCCCGPKSSSCHGNSPSTSSCSTLNAETKPRGLETTCKCSTTDNSGAMQIQVNATVQMPPNVGQCTVNITATTNTRLDTGGTSVTVTKSTNNFNGGGLVQMDTNPPAEREDDTPTSPVSWLMPFLYECDTSPKDQAKLVEIKRLLNSSGWYHEELSWQQSKDLLKNAPVGQWLMRNSSDSRYTFAVSVQTSKGPTSVRVLYAYGQFRLDSDPRLAIAIRSFDCPIKMLEYYTKALDDQRDEVWVDNSGLFFSQIILTQPLVKEVRSLSHLARLSINRHKLNIDNLPSLIKNYIAEYPYTF